MGFWLGPLRFGLPGQQLTLPRRQRQSQASLCYESHIVWPGPAWGGGPQEHWGASSYSPGCNPASGPPGPCPLPQHILAPPRLPLGLRRVAQGEGLGKRQWRREQRERISRGRKQGSGRIGEKWEAGKERRGAREDGQERPRRREKVPRHRESLPGPCLSLSPGSRSSVLKGASSPEDPALGAGREERT